MLSSSRYMWMNERQTFGDFSGVKSSEIDPLNESSKNHPI